MADPIGFNQFFGGAAQGMNDALYDSFMEAIKSGKRIYLSDRPGTLESKIQAFYDQTKSLTRADFDRIKTQHFGQAKKPGPPPAPPPPKSANGPAPLTSPLSPGLLASMASAAAAAPGYPTATPSPAPAPPPPPRPAPPPPPPPSWPANMMGGGFPQPPPPPPPPSWPANMMPSPWPASMTGGGRPPGSVWPANMGPPPAPYNINPGAGVFPQNMQPRVPKPPGPKPTRFRTFKSAFGSAYARQAKYGVASVGRAGQAAFTGAFPEAAIPLALAREGLETIKSTIRAMVTFTERINEGNKRLAQYNGQIAIAYTRLAIGDFYRDVNLANRTAPSSEALVRAINRMRDGFQEFRVLQGNLMNNFATFQARAFGNVGEALNPFVAKLNEVLGRDAGAGGFQLIADVLTHPLVKFLDDLKGVLGAFGMKFPNAAAAGPVLGPWDQFAADVLKGNVGGPILPKAGPRPGIGGGAAINFGRGI